MGSPSVNRMKKEYVAQLWAEDGQTSEVYLTKKQYDFVDSLVSNGEKGLVNIEGTMIATGAVKLLGKRKQAIRDYRRMQGDMRSKEQARMDFLRGEEEYRAESPREKAKREYYSRFMGMILACFGLKRVFGSDYESPANVPTMDQGGWEFTGVQRQDRRRRFDAWVAQSDWSSLWGKDLKNFLVEYFEKNPNKSWCDLEEWWPIFVEGKIPTTRFDRVLIAHDHQVRNI